jgi:hypothetical protein
MDIITLIIEKNISLKRLYFCGIPKENFAMEENSMFEDLILLGKFILK